VFASESIREREQARSQKGIDVVTSEPLVAVSSAGTSIAVWRSGSGPSLVLVHGTTADHTRWARVSEGFEANFTVFAMDRRGRGGSGDAETYSIAEEGEDIEAVVRMAKGPVTLLGHSYGALCCLEAALRLPDLHRLVLYEPPLPLGLEIVSPEVRAELTQLLERNERDAALAFFFREVVRVPQHQLEAMRGSPAWAGRVAAAHTLAREIRVEADYQLNTDRLRALRTPTLLLLGGDSPAYFSEAVHELDRTIPNSTVRILAGQQHIAMDTAPDEFIAVVTAFARHE
jgi:pimeloyl-ACP methyl ester carboxylesterase